MTFPVSLWLLLAVAAVVSAVGFYRYLYFISVGYGFSVSGIGVALLIFYRDSLTPCLVILCLLLLLYGLRLGGFLLLREWKGASYRERMKGEIKDGDSVSLGSKLSIWVMCALLYTMQTSPILYRLSNGEGADALCIIGAVVMAAGLLLESAADRQKSALKKKAPNRFCDTGLYRLVRCPNYLGEMVFWTGVLLAGLTTFSTVGQWVIALLGYLGIVYIMFSGARRLELRQNRNYGEDPEYGAYCRKTPILIPVLPLYSLAKYAFLVG